MRNINLKTERETYSKWLMVICSASCYESLDIDRMINSNPNFEPQNMIPDFESGILKGNAQNKIQFKVHFCLISIRSAKLIDFI